MAAKEALRTSMNGGSGTHDGRDVASAAAPTAAPPDQPRLEREVKPVRSTYMSEDDTMGAGKWDRMNEDGTCNPAATICGILCFPMTLIGSWYTVNERQEAVILRCGKYETRTTDPGCHFSNLCGRDLRKVSVARQTLELPVTKIIDLDGNPLNVSAIVTFYVKSSQKAALNVVNYVQFVRDQAQAVMKQVVSRYPYEAHDAGAHSLKTETAVIGKELVELLQMKADIAGVKIVSFDLNEIAYAPEIAANMLRRQQANALVAARRTIVDGAVLIATDAVAQLKRNHIEMDLNQQTHLVTNLLTVICSDKDAQPTVPLT